MSKKALKFLRAALLVAGLVLAAGQAYFAQAQPTLNVHPSGGGATIMTGSGYIPNIEVAIKVDGVVKQTVRTDMNGSFAIELKGDLRPPRPSPSNHPASGILIQKAIYFYSTVPAATTSSVNASCTSTSTGTCFRASMGEIISTSSPKITADKSFGIAGDKVTLKGSKFHANSPIEIKLEGVVIGSTMSDINGSWKETVMIPAISPFTSPGNYTWDAAIPGQPAFTVPDKGSFRIIDPLAAPAATTMAGPVGPQGPPGQPGPAGPRGPPAPMELTLGSVVMAFMAFIASVMALRKTV